jgi:myosin heavy subunit
MLKRLALYLIILLPLQHLAAQDANTTDTATVQLKSPEKYIDAVADKAKGIEERLNKKSEKALVQLKKQEEKIINKLGKIDSNAAKQLKENATARYKELEEKLKNQGKLQQYIPHLDSLGTSLNFLTQNSQLLKNTKEIQDKLKDAVSKVDALKAQLQKAENLKQFLKERKEFLKQQVEKFGFAKQLKKLNKQVYYYSQQIAEYKEILKDPKKIEKKALELLAKTKVFQGFMRKNSMLAGILGFPTGTGQGSSGQMANLTGLQTRVQIASILQQQIGASGPNAQQLLQQNLQGGGLAPIQQLRNRVSQLRGADVEMPNFTPNNQKTKSFLKRLEYGFNLQSQKATNYFPTTSDLGLSLGFMANDKSIIGIGISYKIGLGNGWRDIRFSSQGIGLRSYLDFKMKSNFFISGGYEQNYKSAFNDFDILRSRSGWQQSGLLGFSKKYKMTKKLNGKAQLLWDFLSYQQIPRTQPIVLRFGISLK